MTEPDSSWQDDQLRMNGNIMLLGLFQSGKLQSFARIVCFWPSVFVQYTEAGSFPAAHVTYMKYTLYVKSGAGVRALSASVRGIMPQSCSGVFHFTP